MNKNTINIALLLLRIGFAFSVAYAHGYGKITGGPAKWEKLGGSMEDFGITFAPVFWGFMAAFAEFFGALLIGFGFLTRLGAFLLGFTMLVAFYGHIHAGDGFGDASHSFDLMCVSVFFLITGAGKYSIDNSVKISKWLQ
ncbi:MAG: DoxX family protein [Bacteroidota bacterium]